MADINTLYTHLFETLQSLKDGKIDIDQARSINDTAQTIVNVAKVEVDYIKVSGRALSSSFIAAIPAPEAIESAVVDKAQVTGTGIRSVEKVAGGTVTTHRIR